MPSGARVRRAISTAYYALFTALTAEVARPFRRNVKSSVRQLVEHGKARLVCITLRKNRSCSQLSEFARRFETLYVIRLRADYDHTYEPDKSDAESAIKQARFGIECLSRARAENPDQVQIMCVSILATDVQRKQIGQQAGGT